MRFFSELSRRVWKTDMNTKQGTENKHIWEFKSVHRKQSCGKSEKERKMGEIAHCSALFLLHLLFGTS